MMLSTGGAWQRRSARPRRWQSPCGRRCRAVLRLSSAPSATRIIRALFARGLFQAIEHHTQDLTIAKEVGDRAGKGKAYYSLGDYSKATKDSSTTGKAWRLQRRWATGGGRAGRTGTSVTRISCWGIFERPSSHKQDLEIAKAMDDRAGEVKSYGKLGNAYYSLGDYSKLSSTTRRT
jgi:hypothetical protein